MAGLTIDLHWLDPDTASIEVSTGDAVLRVNWLTAGERQQLAKHLREVADELSPSREENLDG
jgi:hypothetical protein